MRDLFKSQLTNRTVREKYKVNMVNQISYGKKSLRIFGPKLWNSLSYHIKSSENLESFKRIIKDWFARFAIAVNKLIFGFNVDILFLLNCFKFKTIHYYICYIGEFLYRIILFRRKDEGRRVDLY